MEHYLSDPQRCLVNKVTVAVPNVHKKLDFSISFLPILFVVAGIIKIRRI